MGKRGPKPTIEGPTTHIRVPVALAEALRNGARREGKPIASYLIDNLREGALRPIPPSEGGLKAPKGVSDGSH